MGFGALLLIPALWSSPKNHQEDLEMGENVHDSHDDDHGDGEDDNNSDPDVEDDDPAGDSHETSHESSPENTDTPAPQQATEAPTKLSWFSRAKTALFGPSDDEDDEGFIPNYRLLPIVSGIIIPFSILLEIPGLTEKWYIRTEENKIVETQPNTVILNAGLGVSMFCALVANVCVVLRFLEKGEVKRMTIIAIIALTIHGVYRVLRNWVLVNTCFCRCDQYHKYHCFWG